MTRFGEFRYKKVIFIFSLIVLGMVVAITVYVNDFYKAGDLSKSALKLEDTKEKKSS